MKNNIEDISREIHVIQSKKNAILFAEFVSDYQVFDDFWSMSKEHQETIYQQYLIKTIMGKDEKEILEKLNQKEETPLCTPDNCRHGY
tara:strand:- start:357 stop:620 length:264 start_codon:yes stop_codon:yes gene_type:complete